MNRELAYSRPFAAAGQLGELAADRHRFAGKRVLLTGEGRALTTANGQECLFASLRLLIRFCRNVTVWIPEASPAIVNESHRLAEELAFGPAVAFAGKTPEPTQFDAILNVGSKVVPQLPWTAISANGWIAYVSSGATGLPIESDQANPIAALAAASLGVTEVFKRLIALKPTRGVLFDGLAFSLYSYRTDDLELGPPLPSILKADLLLVGAGAIGNGIIYLLRHLPLTGAAIIVDNQLYALENLGTCIMLGPAMVGVKKAVAAAEMLGPRISATPFAEDISTLTDLSRNPCSRIALSALDSVEARHAVQDLWPDLVIDGAIGSFLCQVSRHPWEGDVACLRCLFREETAQAAELVQSQATGLDRASLQNPLDVLGPEHVARARSERQHWLRARIGRPICAIVQEGVAEALSQVKQARGFQPSVPFVACLSAAMVVGELVKALMGGPPLESRYQFDAIRGPVGGLQFPQGRRRNCICMARRGNIERLRTHRHKV